MPRIIPGLLLVLSHALLAQAADRPEGKAFATRSVTVARHGMVAAAHPLAVLVGVDILKKGGSAVDAAIAVNAALALMEPVSCGLGGDLFALVWDPESQRLYGLNGSGRAPKALTRDKVPPGPDGTIPLYSPYTWTVPGCVDGWGELHRRFGRLPWGELFRAVIVYAREGVPVPQVIAGAWKRGARLFASKPGFAQVFLPQGRPLEEGEVFANPALAGTLEVLARDGYRSFYEGPIAKQIVAFSQKHGGFFALEDLAQHRSEWVEPISTTYRGWQVWQLPPNTQGLAVLQMLNILEQFDLKSLGRDHPDFWHLLVEAKKLAFADRARFYADPAFAKVPVEALLAKSYARHQAQRIDLNRAAAQVEPGNPQLSHGDTTFLVTADARGMMVSLIQSNYTGFGSGYVIPELGFGLHNRGALFSLQEGHPNALQPGKRPFHTIIPAFLGQENRPLMAFGVMGGDMQPQGQVQIVVNIVDFGMNVQEAGDAPRCYHTGSAEPTGTAMADGGRLALESGVPWEVRRELLRRGHTLVELPGTVFGGYQAIFRHPKSGVYFGATESRKDGIALGY
ncbi:MAG: gamma-glutamyltransferase [Thermoanaerobaculum sp.]|nr:gamma-glutamyltransferase [Thermoanaerobaculum sp.]